MDPHDKPERSTIRYDLHAKIRLLIEEFPQISAVFIFGSRAYQTQSLRSDVDLLIVPAADQHLKASALRDFTQQHCPPFDCFIVDDRKAISCINDSYVQAPSKEALIARLDATRLWTREEGLATDFPQYFEVHRFAQYGPTTLPNAYLASSAFESMLRRAEESDLPVRPFIGDTIDKVAAQVIDVIERCILNDADFAPRSGAPESWVTHPKSEYDCQSLLLLLLKPWLRTVGREEVTITYDGQQKSADFNLFQSQLVIEVKYIDSDQKKREVVKTLDGLATFYKQNANVKVLLFVIFVSDQIDIDAERWEADFTHFTTSPRVVTTVVRFPA